MGKKIILSIDGGGIRGIIPVALLKRLNDLLKYQLQNSIDLYAGTSTGSLIGGALMLKTDLGYVHNIKDILNLYSLRSSSIFKVSSGAQQSPLKFIMDKTFQNITVKEQSHDFLFTTEDNSTKSLYAITNRCSTLKDVRLSEILLACSAIKGYFEPVIINGMTLSDGVTVMKNPSLFALKYYQELYPEDEMILISFGTGDVSKHYNDEVEQKVLDTHKELLDLSASSGRFSYYRIQPELKHAKPEMDDTSPENIQNLLIDAQVYLNSNTFLFDDIASNIKKAKYNPGKHM